MTKRDFDFYLKNKAQELIGKDIIDDNHFVHKIVTKIDDAWVAKCSMRFTTSHFLEIWNEFSHDREFKEFKCLRCFPSKNMAFFGIYNL